MRTKTILAAALIGLGCLKAAAQEPPKRVASLNLCADQVLMALMEPQAIASLGPFARDPLLSAGAEKAKAFEQNRGTAESVLKGRPDLTVIGTFDNAQTRRLLEASGARLFILPPWRGFEASSADLLALGEAIGRKAQAEALVQAIAEARGRAQNAARPGLRALVLGRGGYVDISQSLVHDLIGAVGLKDMGANEVREGKVAGRFLPLETILTLKPDLLILGEGSMTGEDRKAQVFAHPAFRKTYPEGAKNGPRRIVLPERLTSCGGPSLIEALERLSSAVKAVQ